MKNPGVQIRYELRTHPIMTYPLKAKKEPFIWREIEEYTC